MKNKLITILLTGVLSLGIAGCGLSQTAESTTVINDTATEDNTQETIVAEAENPFPITIQHGLGEITINEKPERIVAIAWGNPDVPLALGLVPVGISEANFGPRDENGLLAWTAEAFARMDVSPNVFDDTDGWDYEAISDCAPDVILAAYSGLSEEEYNRLSEIAPVVAYPGIPWTTTWQEETINNALALGMEEEGRLLVSETEDLIAQKLSEYPLIKDKKAAFFWLSEDDLGTFYIYTSNDPRAAFLGDLGLVTPDSVSSLITDNSAFSVTVSAENADLLNDVDIIITYGTETLVDAMQQDARFANIPAVKNGSFVLLDSQDDLAAASTPTVLSIPYSIDSYLSALNDAAEKINQ